MSKALLVVDVQNDFCEGGSLGVAGGHEVAQRLSEHVAAHGRDYAAVVASRDWHDADNLNGGHFAAQGSAPDFATTWPVHCVAGTPGAEYAPELDTAGISHHVLKGMGAPAYSMFEGTLPDGTRLTDLLAGLGVDEVEVGGIATDYCVRQTCLDAAAAGLRVRLLPGLHAGVAAETSQRALTELAEAGVSTR